MPFLPYILLGLAALILNCIPPLSSFLDLILVGTLHELGHFFASILSGRPAVPVYFLATVNFEFSWLFVVCLFGLWIGGATYSYYNKRTAWVVLFAVFTICQCICSFFLSDPHFQQLVLLCGFAGEALLATLLLQDLPLPQKIVRYRYALLFTGSYGVICSLKRWINAYLDSAAIPNGSLMLGADHGDLNRLRDNFDWSDQSLITLYLILVLVCLVGVIARIGSATLQRRLLPIDHTQRNNLFVEENRIDSRD